MYSMFRMILSSIGAAGVTIGAMLLFSVITDHPYTPQRKTQTSLAPVPSALTKIASSTTPPIATTSPRTPSPIKAIKSASKSIEAPSTTTVAQGQIKRIGAPYAFAPSSIDTINEWARSATVNILCTPRSGGFYSVSGSGVVIDPRGVILTNAHVAQYVLLSEDPRVNLLCSIRTGAPARPRWHVQVLYLPPAWVEEHAEDLRKTHPTGTGEHDYALLYVTDSIDGSVIPPLPALSFDTREEAAFTGDTALAVSYPAEFIGGIAAQFDLYSISSIATIGDLYTLGSSTVDVLSLGGIIQAQGGSSGGAVVNLWNYLIGVITTTTEGTTTAARDLHALTLSYINRDLTKQSGSGLKEILAGDLDKTASNYRETIAPELIEKLFESLPKHQ